jgi:hypothetical protein
VPVTWLLGSMLENSSPVLESRRAAPFCLLRGTF